MVRFDMLAGQLVTVVKQAAVEETLEAFFEFTNSTN
jgi:hypothetical protein